tara:strand:- start:197 stop:913 length:717 start_codon:yes stop_codon:yes gene_type:complete
MSDFKSSPSSVSGGELDIHDTTTSSANAGGQLRLSSDDGAPMGDSHRLGVVEFTGAEDSSGTQVVGGRIEVLTDAAWTNVENGAAMYFYTTDGNASQTNVLKLDSNKNATFAGKLAVTAGGLTITAGPKICGRETVAAAGSDQSTGTAVTCSHPFVAVTGADNAKGVTLAAVSGLTAGQTIKLFNFANATLEVYPASGNRIYPAADDAGITVAAYGFLELMVYDNSTGWVGNEGVIGA